MGKKTYLAKLESGNPDTALRAGVQTERAIRSLSLGDHFLITKIHQIIRDKAVEPYLCHFSFMPSFRKWGVGHQVVYNEKLREFLGWKEVWKRKPPKKRSPKSGIPKGTGLSEKTAPPPPTTVEIEKEEVDRGFAEKVDEAFRDVFFHSQNAKSEFQAQQEALGKLFKYRPMALPNLLLLGRKGGEWKILRDLTFPVRRGKSLLGVLFLAHEINLDVTENKEMELMTQGNPFVFPTANEIKNLIKMLEHKRGDSYREAILRLNKWAGEKASLPFPKDSMIFDLVPDSESLELEKKHYKKPNGAQIEDAQQIKVLLNRVNDEFLLQEIVRTIQAKCPNRTYTRKQTGENPENTYWYSTWRTPDRKNKSKYWGSQMPYIARPLLMEHENSAFETPYQEDDDDDIFWSYEE